MLIDILDPDIHFASALKKRIEMLHRDISCETYLSEVEWNKISRFIDDDYLLIFTSDFYPDFHPIVNCIELRDELPNGTIVGGNQDSISRLGPLDKILEQVDVYLQKSSLRLNGLKPITCFIDFQFDELLNKTILSIVQSNHLSGIQSLIIELGPVFYFHSSQNKSKNFLLDLSLENISPDNISKYLEPWPESPLAMRLMPPLQTDDWLLSPIEFLRKSLYLLITWADNTYAHKWRLIVSCKQMPFAHISIVTSMSEEVIYSISNLHADHPNFSEELSTLAASLPANSTLKAIEEVVYE